MPEPSAPGPGPRNVLPELIIPAMALLFTIYYLTTITEVPWIAQASAVLVSSLLILSILAFGVRIFFRVRDGQEYLSVRDALRSLAFEKQVNLRRLLLLVFAVLYIALLPWLGFSLATFILIFSSIIVLSVGRSNSSNMNAGVFRAFMISFVCSFIGYVAFIIFKTRFPEGPIERLIEGWLR